MNDIVTEAKKIINKPDRQINKIIKIAKYNFKWGRKAIYNFILRNIPGLIERTDEASRKFYSTRKLFAAMSKSEKSQIIKILEQIERRNNEKRQNNNNKSQ